MVDIQTGDDVPFDGNGTIERDGLLTCSEGIDLNGVLTLQNGILDLSALTIGTGELRGWGDAFIRNSMTITGNGAVTVIADMQIVSDVLNVGTINVQNGTLTIDGNLTNNGTINGSVFDARNQSGPRAAGDGIMVSGEFTSNAGSTFIFDGAESAFRTGGSLNFGITDFNDFDVVGGEIAMVAVDGAQKLELMSTDIGATTDGLVRAAGQYPIGTLRIGPTTTTVDLVDVNDNDQLGQGTKEVLYVDTLIIEPAATLATNGCRIYYNTLVNNGTVDDVNNLIPICTLTADANGDGAVNFADLDQVLDKWNQMVAPGTNGDVNGDGAVNFADLDLVLDQWNQSCP